MGYARRGMDILLMVKLLCLLGAANGAPVVAAKLLGARFGRALDGGWRFVDGRPLFGPSKTWRGLVVAVAGGAVVAVPLGWSWQLGAGVALAAMAGDLISSFIKRRLGLPSSSMCLGLDQVPEALLPLLLLWPVLGMTPVAAVVIVAAFFVAELSLSWLLYQVRWRDQPW